MELETARARPGPPSHLPDPLILLAEGCQAEKRASLNTVTGVVRENEEREEQ